jgi:hypothetical protein
VEWGRTWPKWLAHPVPRISAFYPIWIGDASDSETFYLWGWEINGAGENGIEIEHPLNTTPIYLSSEMRRRDAKSLGVKE